MAADGDEKDRRRRRAWTFIGLAAAVALVLAATVTVPGWQRTVTLSVVVVGVVGLIAVRPLLQRAPKPADDEEKKVDWIAPLAGASIFPISQLIRSVGPERGGVCAFVATLLAGLLLVMPAQLALDAGLRIRRARKLADESATLPVSEPPNPRP